MVNKELDKNTPLLRRREWKTILLIAALFLLLWVLLPKPAFWGLDNGIKYSGSRAFAETGSISLVYDGAVFDSLGVHRPLPRPFSVMHKSKMVPTFPVLFMILGGIFYAIFGSWGPFLLPLLGGYLTLFGCWVLWRLHRKEHDGRLFLVLVGLGTPLLFYSLEYWEHAVAAGFLVLSVAFTNRRRSIAEPHRRRNTFLGGVFLGLAVGMRSETILWGVVTLLLWPKSGHSWRSTPRYLIGLFVVLIPIAALNYWQTGALAPLHISANYLSVSINSISKFFMTRITNVYEMLVEGFSENYWSFLGIIPLVITGVWRGWRIEKGIWIWLFVLVSGVWLLYIVKALLSANQVNYTLLSGGLLWVTPAFALALLPLQSERRRIWFMMWFGSVLYVALIASLAPTTRGVHFGTRVLVPVMPFLAAIVAIRAHRWWERYAQARPIIMLLVAISIITQLYSYNVQQKARHANVAVNRWASAVGSETVLTTMWWFSGDCALVSYGKPWYLTDRGDRLADVVSELRKRGETSFSCIGSPPYIDDAFWQRIGVRRVGEEYFYSGRRSEIRRTRLTITNVAEAPEASAVPE